MNRNDDFKMENCKYLVFSGDIRNFARFKADFENFVVPIHSSKQKLAYVIKLNCLKGSALKHVSNFTDLDDI